MTGRQVGAGHRAEQAWRAEEVVGRPLHEGELGPRLMEAPRLPGPASPAQQLGWELWAIYIHQQIF